MSTRPRRLYQRSFWTAGCIGNSLWAVHDDRQLQQGCFELGGWPIGQRRMQSLAIVDVVDEDADCLTGVTEIAIIPAVDLLLLECLHEALGLGAVVRVTDAAYARLGTVRLQQDRVLATSVLHPRSE